MKSIFVLALSLISFNSFAQINFPQRGNSRPQPQVQLVTVQPGSSTFIQALVPTQVICEGSVATMDPNLRCTVERLSDVFGNITFVVRQNGKELSNRVNTMDAALSDLTKLRNAGLCY